MTLVPVLNGLCLVLAAGLATQCASAAPLRIDRSAATSARALADVALPGKKDGQFMYGVKPCVGQRQANGTYALLSLSQAYGCTEPYFLIREAFQRRTAMFRYDEFRRPSFWQVDMNFAKTTPITDSVRFQVRFEAFNLFNSPMYDERNYNTDTNSADFGRINRNITAQSNFQRFVQLGFRLIF